MKIFNLKCLLLMACSFSGGLAYAQDISVTCPVLPSADHGKRLYSRPAEFNWHFESANGGDVQIGRYACGSYWVAPAVGDTGVRVVSLSGSDNPGQVDLLSLDADPITEKMGLVGLVRQTANLRMHIMLSHYWLKPLQIMESIIFAQILQVRLKNC